MSLDRFKNIEQVEGRTPVYGETLSPKPFTVSVPLTWADVNGDYPGAFTSQNMEYHIYSENNLLVSAKGLPIPSVTQGSSIGSLNEIITLKPEKDLRDSGIIQGAYSIVYNFLHTFNEGTITEISSDRTEVVIRPRLLSVSDGLLAPSEEGAPQGTQVVQTQGGPVSLLPGSQPPASATAINFNGLRTYYNSVTNYIPDVVLNLGENNLIDVANIEFDGTRIGFEVAERDYPTDVFDGIPTIYVPVDGRIESEPLGTWVPFVEVFNPAINQNLLRYGVPTGRARRFKLKRASDTPQNAGFVNRIIWEPGSTVFTNFDYPEDINYHPQPNTRHRLQDLKIYYEWFNETIETFDRLIVKLTEPLSDDILTGTQLSIDNRIRRSWVEKIVAFPSNIDVDRPSFSEPDFNMDLTDLRGADGTEFETYNSLLDVNATTSQQLINRYFSGSLGEVRLNIDYSDFTNHVHFSSATERIDNFLYKLQQIEKFNDRIDLLQTVTSSAVYTNISQSIVRRDRIIGGFDDFEHYLYYNEDSNYYTHWSSSANIISPYPKSSTFPHVLRRTTSTEGESWYNGTYSSASLYDAFNDSRLRNMIPVHLQEDERNEEYITFVDMIGQHFDIQWSYINSLTEINSREEHPKDGMSGDLLKSVAESLGWKLSNGYSDTNLWSYALGVETDGTLYQSGSLKSKPREEIVKETWRRIVNTIPMLYKTKGTARSVKALLATYGIPQAFLQIREFGGPTVPTRRNVYERERFVNKLEVSATEYISNPWGEINGDEPFTIETILKLPKNDFNIMMLDAPTNSYNLIWDYDTANNRGRLQLKQNNSSVVQQTNYIPYLNRRDCVVTLNSGSPAFDFAIAQADDFGEILSSEAVSLIPAQLPAFNTAWQTATAVLIGSGSTTSTASFQEVRYYTKRLSEEIVQEHAKNREAYFSDDNTTDLDIDTAYDTLIYRIQPDSGFKTNTTSISSVHPNQQKTKTDANVILSASIVNMGTSNLIGEVDTQFVTIPSVGALNLMNNKVRIESASLRGELNPDSSQEISEYDYAPNDSNVLGTYFSTTDTVNYDIYNSEGYFEIDDWVGDTDKRYNEDYPLLKYRARNYFQKYTSGTAIDLILDMLARYDMSVFDQIKQLLPARVDWHKGILIEPHILERNKYRRNRDITYSRHHYDGTINVNRNVITASRNDYDAGIIDLYDYQPSSYSNDTVVNQTNTTIQYPTSAFVTSSVKPLPQGFGSGSFEPGGSKIRFTLGPTPDRIDGKQRFRVSSIVNFNEGIFEIESPVYASQSLATLQYTASVTTTPGGLVSAFFKSGSIVPTPVSAAFENVIEIPNGTTSFQLTGSNALPVNPASFDVEQRTYTLHIVKTSVNAQFRGNSGAFQSPSITIDNDDIIEDNGNGLFTINLGNVSSPSGLQIRTTAEEQPGDLGISWSFSNPVQTIDYFGTNIVTASNSLAFIAIDNSFPEGSAFVRFNDGTGTKDYSILRKIGGQHVVVDTSSHAPNTSGSTVSLALLQYSQSKSTNILADAFTNIYGAGGATNTVTSFTYVSQRQQGYWDYSPTGSTVLNARESKIYKIPKYFYSSSYSASVNLPSSTSMEYAQVQDTRLPLAMENLFFNGCRITSDSLTTDSPDTPDGGPVVEITTVDPNVLVFNGNSENDEAVSLNDASSNEVRTIPTTVLLSNKKKASKKRAQDSRKSKLNESDSLRPLNFRVTNTRPKPRIQNNKQKQVENILERIFRRFRR